jgi:hypothetical protein
VIRRDIALPDGSPGWALISQIEHARLSGICAEHWAGLPPDIKPRAEFVAAVDHHDDGWAGWEQFPQVDLATGQPRDFTEMPLAESLQIWRGSIAAAAALGPLAGYMVSGHFAALLRRFPDRWNSDARKTAQAESFLDEQGRQQQQWQSAWQAAAPGRVAAAAERAVSWLQFFDVLSLWLCCAERLEAEAFAMPAGSKIQFIPRTSQAITVQAITVTPWPFSVRELPLSVAARAVPQTRYQSAAALAAVAAATVSIGWNLSAPGRG